MQKISAGYLNKKMPPIQELNQADSNQQWYTSSTPLETLIL